MRMIHLYNSFAKATACPSLGRGCTAKYDGAMTEQDLSIATHVMCKFSRKDKMCMPFSRESMPEFGTLFLI